MLEGDDLQWRVSTFVLAQKYLEPDCFVKQKTKNIISLVDTAAAAADADGADC